MFGILPKIFVKNYEDVKDAKVRSEYGTLASVVGIILNVILSVSKFIVGALSGAISISADAVNNLSDAGSQVISLVSFRLANKPADRDHPFGHARIELVASMTVSFLILHAGFDLITESAQKLANPEPVSKEKWIVTVAVLGASIIAKLWLGLFNRVLGKKIDSQVMRATSSDSFSDALSTTAVLLGLALYLIFDWVWIDAVMGICVAAVIFVAGIKIFIEAKNSILGEKPDDGIVDGIKKIVKKYPEALGIHDMVVHNYGPGRIIASLHVEVDGKGNIYHLHDMIDNIEQELRCELDIEACIHMDPIVTDDEKVTEMRKKVTECVQAVDARLKIHDFRMVTGTTHTNLIFDIDAPFEVDISNDDIKKSAIDRIKELGGNCFCIIKVDRD